MNQNVRRAVSAIALSSLAATMVSCRQQPQLNAGNPGLGQQTTFGARNATANAEMKKVDDAARAGLNAVPGEYNVVMRPGVGAQSLSALGANFTSKNIAPNIVTVKANGGVSAQSDQATIQQLRSNPNVLAVEPNYIVTLNDPQVNAPTPDAPHLAGSPDDPLFDKQWHHKTIGSVPAWAKQKGSKSILVAMVDTGMDCGHPDIAANIDTSKTFSAYNDDGCSDKQGHGTHVGGTVAALANNGVGVAGVAPGVTLMSAKVLSDSGSGSYASVAAGIVAAADAGANVISMSLGGPSNSAVITEAIKHAISKGALPVAAMGNDGNSSVSYPAGIPGVFSVGATDINNKIARFSQFGPHIGISAPGVNIMATFPRNASGMPGTNYGAISGTSMATPIVAAVAALVMSQNPGISAEQVKAILKASAVDQGEPGFDNYFGAGIVNAEAALNASPAGVAAQRVRR
jgi:thermitase